MLNYQELKSLAVIPARGGSKSIPRKNIRELAGKPLIYWTIKAAQASGVLDRLVVSTDDREIADISRSFDVEVVMRPVELAQDTSPTEDALIHCLDYLKEKDGFEPTIVLTLEPTAPLRSAETIKGVVELYKTTEADSVMTVEAEDECHLNLVDGKIDFLVKNQPRRRQDRKPLYKENGGTYLTEVKVLREKRKVLGDNLYGYVLPKNEAVDINDILDFQIAEMIMQIKNKKI